MHDWESLSHVRWDCKYHVVIVRKYLQNTIYRKLKRNLGIMLRDLCRQWGVDFLELDLMKRWLANISVNKKKQKNSSKIYFE